MIREVFLSSIDDVMLMAKDHQYQEQIDRYRSSYFYRGVPDANYNLTTSLRRNCDDAAPALEGAILRNFTKYASIEDPTLDSSIWKQMIIGQHHGLPTRLLDWTHSSLVALNFATTEDDLGNLDKRDCAVWRIDVRELNKNLPQKYKDALDTEKTFIFSVKALDSVVSSLKDYDQDMGNHSFVCLEPPSVDQRIINQYSFFTVIPSGIENITNFLEDSPVETIKYVIDKSIRWQLRDILDQFNVNERIIYPGLDGLSKWIARHYYKKKSNQYSLES